MNRLAMPQRGKITKFFFIAEGDNLQRDWSIDFFAKKERAKNRAHLLESLGDFASALLAGIGHHRKMWGANLHPIGSIGHASAAKGQCKKSNHEATAGA